MELDAHHLRAIMRLTAFEPPPPHADDLDECEVLCVRTDAA